MEDGISDAYTGEFPAADANAELNPGQDKDFKVDALSKEIITSKQIKGGGEPPGKKEKKNSMQTLKTTMLVSAVMVALAGVVIIITKKLKEK